MKTRQTILVLLGILLVGALAVWWYLGFTFDFSRFFAAGLEGTIDTPVNANSATSTVTNNSPVERVVSLISFCASESPSVSLDSQVVHEITRVTIPAGEARLLEVEGCGCYTQYDLTGGDTSLITPGMTYKQLVDMGISLGLIHYKFATGTGFCPAAATHLECSNNACVVSRGAGANEDGCMTAGQACGGLICSPAQQSVAVGQPAAFTASGGQTTSSFNWSAPGGVPPTFSSTTAPSQTFSTTYAVPGSYTVTVTKEGMTATCAVAVTAGPSHLACDANRACVITPGAGENTCTTSADCPALPTLTCAPATSTVTSGGSQTFTATGGVAYCEGDICYPADEYAWTSNDTGAVVARRATFTRTFVAPGSYTITATQNNRTATCTVTVPAAATHLACDTTTQACVVTAGAGANTCSIVGGVDSCATGATHLACNPDSLACVVVQGAGANTCTTSADCAIPALTCSPATQAALLNQAVPFEAHGGVAPFTWTAVGATPPSGSGASFSASYPLVGAKTVTVTDSRSLTATCAVTVSASPTHLACSGNACVTTAGAGANTCATSADCATTVTHLECNNDACVRVSGAGSNECAPEGSFCGAVTTPRLSIEKLVRNVTQSTPDRSNVTANPGDIVEFSLRVFSTGTGTVNSVSVRDALPAGLTYLPGTTTIDNVRASDGIITSRLNIGSMAAGRTIIVRFQARVSPASFFSTGTTVLTNVGFARGSNAPEVSDTAFVTVLNTPPSLSITLSKLGRNVTRGELGEGVVVRSSPAQTLQFILRVRNTSAATLTNVLVRDVLPPVITLVPGSVTVGGAAGANSLTAAGLSIGNLAAGQEIVIMFSGLVAPAVRFPAGTTIVLNTATVTATGVPVLTTQLPIIITNGVIVIPPVQTGPGETTVLALIVSAIITLLYVGYTSTETFRRHEAGAIAKESRGDSSDFK